jgi:DNA-binding YbaB/EbfC family protein
MGNFNGGMNEMMRQAARLQRRIDQVKKECGDREHSVSAVGDKVKATVTLGGKVSRIEIDPEFLKTEGLELSLDSACAAINSALEQAEKQMEAELAKVTGGMKVPGL